MRVNAKGCDQLPHVRWQILLQDAHGKCQGSLATEGWPVCCSERNCMFWIRSSQTYKLFVITFPASDLPCNITACAHAMQALHRTSLSFRIVVNNNLPLPCRPKLRHPRRARLQLGRASQQDSGKCKQTTHNVLLVQVTNLGERIGSADLVDSLKGDLDRLRLKETAGSKSNQACCSGRQLTF